MSIPFGDLKDLICLLKDNGVSTYKTEGLELTFGTITIAPNLTQAETQAPLPTETQSPDLKADDLFDFDKVLHWSGSGDPEPMPLTGEVLAAP